MEKSSDSNKEINEKLFKISRILLTFFYGQFSASAIYNNLLRRIPLLINKPIELYPVFKVILGLLMFIFTVYSMIVIWMKLWRFIFASGIGLIVLSVIALKVTLIDFVSKKTLNEIPDSEFGCLTAELILETLIRILAIIMTFFLARFIKDQLKKDPNNNKENLNSRD